MYGAHLDEAGLEHVMTEFYGRCLSRLHGKPLTVHPRPRLPLDPRSAAATAERMVRATREEKILAIEMLAGRLMGQVKREVGPDFMDAWSEEETDGD